MDDIMGFTSGVLATGVEGCGVAFSVGLISGMVGGSCFLVRMSGIAVSGGSVDSAFGGIAGVAGCDCFGGS